MDENKEIVKSLRKEFSKSGWALLIYYGIMNAAVSVVMYISMLGLIINSILDPNMNELAMEDQLIEAILSNGWGYALAIAVGLVIMFFWKKKEFCFKTIWKIEKDMSFRAFLPILAIFISGQALSQLLTPILDWLFSLMGISLTESIESATGMGDTFSMFLYICLLAPVSEEILFRGLIMRSLEPYGKKFAILTSAFLFGIFHGNVIQTPYAFAVGLVLGYVAMEYSMVWAMVLHMINNLLLGDTLTRLTQGLPVWVQQLIFAVLIWGCVIAAVIVLIRRRREVSAYFKSGKMHPLCLKAFFTSPGVLVLTAVLMVNVVITLLLQAI